MSERPWFESDGPLVPVVPAHAWVGETIEPMRDGDTLVIRIGEPIVGVVELVRRAAEEWRGEHGAIRARL